MVSSVVARGAVTVTAGDKYYDALSACLSPARLGAYARRLGPTAGKLDILAHYLWNAALSQALYAPVQALEVTLRNSLHAAASAAYGTDRWFDAPGGPGLGVWHQQEIARALARLAGNDRRRLRTPTPTPPATGRIVAELTFGFWVGLFGDAYDPAAHPLWRGDLLIRTFPHIPPDEPLTRRNRRIFRTRRALSVRLNRLLRLRNRVMHHEPIWYWRDPPIGNLGEQHNEILEVLGWVSPTFRATTALNDQFPVVYGQGPTPYRAQLDTFVATLPFP